MKKKICLLFIFYLFSTSIVFSQNMIGGEESYFASELYDPLYPMMKEWAKAGVEGGIPNQNKTIIRREISVNDNIEKIIDDVNYSGGGVILIHNGDYLLKKTLIIPSNVILRGINRDSVRFLIDMHGNFKDIGKPSSAALCINNAEWSGIENLTIRYITPAFEPLDKQHVYDFWEKRIFHEPEMRDTTLFVESILINNSRNCWIDNCQILCSGSDAIRINKSEHITCRKNYIDRTYNKCDGGMGYYNIMRSKYVLSCYEKVRRIRHYAIHIHSKYCVAIHNDFEVDVNFHDGDDGYNLVEDNKIIIPLWHSWHCFQLGDPSQHKPAGKWDVLYNNTTYYKLDGPEFSKPNTVYLMNEKFEDQTVVESALKRPIGNTFYPVKVK